MMAPPANFCSIPDGRSFLKPYALAQGNFNFLKNGVVQPTTEAGMIARNPRTAVAYNASYIYFRCATDEPLRASG